jgi:preprotein translocase subunit SecE
MLNYFRESWFELRNKVTWPTWSELQKTTVIVMLATLAVALIIFGMDIVWKFILSNIYA